MRDVTPPVPSAAYLRSLIEAEGGSISVERFMREALYHPQYGYYARRVSTVGKRGDFSTAATLHPALGQAIAAWAAAHRREVVRRGRWHVIELGGGSGQLAESVFRSIRWWSGRGLQYHLVEISAGLEAAQRARLRSSGRSVQWHADLRSALAAAAGRALVVSNEFVDAFPCVQLVHGPQAGQWREVRVCWPEDAANPVERFGEWAGPTPETGAGGEVAIGQRVESHLAYRRWLENGVTDWETGRMLTVDYGGVPPGLYHRRLHGTLRGYCRHQRVTGAEAYQRFGQQDLTADVNFADLQRWGGAAGFRHAALCTQTEFLRRWLPAGSRRRMSGDPALVFLMDLEGAGGAFKVLEQSR